ncbi:neuronal PAS domain-containing protein 3-like isoform X2 [Lampetra fluviatilis]
MMLRLYPELACEGPTDEADCPQPAEGHSNGGMGAPPTCHAPGSYQQRLQALRKEKSRDAARSRRGKENFEFYELAKLLPLPGAITSQLDKASIVRLSISYLRMRDFAGLGDPPWLDACESPPPNTSVKAIGQRPQRAIPSAIEAFEKHLGSQILQALDGFVLVLNQEGRFLYISETVSIYLGLSQVELTGSSAFEYVHPADHAELAEQLGLRLPGAASSRGAAPTRRRRPGALLALSDSEAPAPKAATAGRRGGRRRRRRATRGRPGSRHRRSVRERVKADSAEEEEVEEEDDDDDCGDDDCGDDASLVDSPPPSPPETPDTDSPASPSSLAAASASDCVLERSFFIRMKSTLTKRGVHIKSSGYKVIHLAARLRRRSSSGGGQAPASPASPCPSPPVEHPLLGLVAVAHALPPPTLSEVRIDCHMFVTKLNLELRVSYCESRISDYMDHTASDIVGKSCYHLIHTEDVAALRLSHLDLINKGQCITNYYRWLQKCGGYIWVQSTATITINTKNADEKTVVSVNYVLSNLEMKGCILDLQQMPSLAEQTTEISTSDSETEAKEENNEPLRCVDGRLGIIENSVIMEPIRKATTISRTDPGHTHSIQQQQQLPARICQSSREDNMKNDSSSDNLDDDDDEDDDDNDDDDDDEDSDAQSDSSDLYEGPKVTEQPRRTVLSRGVKTQRQRRLRNSDRHTEAKATEGQSMSSDSDRDSIDGCDRLEVSKSRMQTSSRLRKRRKRSLRDRSIVGPRKWTLDVSRADKVESPLPAAVHLVTPSLDFERLPKFRLEVSPRSADGIAPSWACLPNREILRGDSDFSMVAEQLNSSSVHSSQTAHILNEDIPESVLASPETDEVADEKEEGGQQRPQSVNNASPGSPSATGSTTASRHRQPSPPLPLSPPVASVASLLYTAGELELLQRLQQQAGLVLPLAAAAAAASASAQPRVYTTGTIRYAPGGDAPAAGVGGAAPAPGSDAGAAAGPHALRPAPPFNLIELNSAALRLDPKASADVIYQHVQRMGAAAAAAAAAAAQAGGVLSADQLPLGAATTAAAAGGVITTAEGLFSGLAFPVYTISLQPAQAERKDE